MGYLSRRGAVRRRLARTRSGDRTHWPCPCGSVRDGVSVGGGSGVLVRATAAAVAAVVMAAMAAVVAVMVAVMEVQGMILATLTH